MMQSKVWMIVSLLVTCLVAAFALSQVYAVTRPTIEKQRADATQKALTLVLSSASRFEEKEKDSLWYGYDASNQKTGIVIRVAERGYGGPVPILLGLDLTGRVLALSVASPAEGLRETPGLGLKAAEPWFTQQFIGSDSLVRLRKEGGTVDAISGATITSRAVARGIAQGIHKYASHLAP